MTIQDFRSDADEEVATILASGFRIEVVETAVVPSFSDSEAAYCTAMTTAPRSSCHKERE